MKLSKPIFALLAMYIPVSVMASVLPLLAILSENLTNRQINSLLPLWFALGLLSAASSSVYWLLIQRNRADHISANIRGAVLAAIISYCLGSLVRLNFLPSMYNIPSALIVLAHWFPVLYLKRFFYIQGLIEYNVQHYEGEKLQEIIFYNASLMKEADEANKNIMKKYSLCFLPVMILLVTCRNIGISLNFFTAAFFVFLFVAGVSIIIFLGFLRREYQHTAEGLAPPNRFRPFTTIAVVILSAAVFGLLLSSNQNLLPVQLVTTPIAAIFNFLLTLLGLIIYLIGTLLPTKDSPIRPVEEPELFRSDGFQHLPQANSLFFWDWVKYAVLAVLAFFFLRFMIAPFLGGSRPFRGLRFLPRKVMILTLIWFRNLRRSVNKFFKSLRGEDKNQRSLSPQDFAALEENILSGLNIGKKRQLRRSISLFARLIYWGTEVAAVPWKPSYAPAEYCSLLALAVEKGLLIIRAGELFEQALYSPRPLSRKEHEEFKTLVKTITMAG